MHYNKRQAIVAGNWKMHGSREFTADLLKNLSSGICAAIDQEATNAQVLVFPPFVYLQQAQQLLSDSAIQWGAQTLSANAPGAYTGEIAAEMLLDFGCSYVIVGHSERRQLMHEDDVLVAMKFAQAQQHGLMPILCVGETLEQREQQQTLDVVAKQLDAVLSLDAGINAFQRAIIAYEPIWAIGTGMTASPEQAQDVHAMIREKLSGMDTAIAEQVSILYGGSVKADNAATLFTEPDIDGFLVGGASLDAQQFLEIVKCIN